MTTPPSSPSRVTRWLARAPTSLFSLYAVVMAFTTYFCMYGFRRPFAVGQYQGLEVAGFDLKTALVASQLCGYALSKILGVKINSEMTPGRRVWALIALIGCAEAALLLFAVLPPAGKLFAIFLNGLPLGMVWGVVFSFIEGRRSSDLLGAGLNCSYILASGMVKSVGAVLLLRGVSESWMPALTGVLFLPLFLAAVWGLSRLPPPTDEDQRLRTPRVPMDKRARRAFLRQYLPGIVVLVLAYAFLTAYRDLRDNFAAELWNELGYGMAPENFTLSEIPIALAVMLVMGLVYLIKDNRAALAVAHGILLLGAALVGGATLLFDAGLISGMVWMVSVGIGLYLAYVPFNCVLFDRMIAALGFVATAVFLIYVSDASAYVGSLLVLLYKELGYAELSTLAFFRGLSYAVSVLMLACYAGSGVYFWQRTRAPAG
ncbi:DUF5690 family protein [Haliangium ochraceum]|uniref:Major facilitator superfamily MFS_1 n=1 Tax=Haliangium ochraceum (strain DSM 14365 / JCM 11303 / SMP-2) TaxID=502025 RepID=D0LNB7_HALO1|nr:DUF5690 family protein [Haliangium ochraceum]ACY15294.1 conserved hypothetical protein [Haliangium ochraceum DSM 14365]